VLYILHPDNGREFTNSVIMELHHLYTELKTAHGKLQHSQSHTSVERAHQNMQNILTAQIADNNNTSHAEALPSICS
jgi:hypothetical protein